MEYDLKQVLELACAAYRLNGYQYIKVAHYEGYGEEQIYRPSNVSRIKYTLGGKNYDDRQLTPVIEEDIQKAEDMRKYFRKLIFRTIQKAENSGAHDYETELYKIITSDTVSHIKISYVAASLYTYHSYLRRDEVKERSKECVREYLGNVGDKISKITCEVIGSIHFKNYDFWVMTAIADNKLISWPNKFKLENDSYFITSARIKKTAPNLHRIPTTHLNHVKIKR